MKGTRIIAGNFKRERLGAVPRSLPVRPMLARIKKSLFDILKNRIPESSFLDLFSGSGSVGFEAFSRGAKKVVWVDSNRRCQEWILGTLERIFQKYGDPGLEEKVKVYHRDVLAGLAWLAQEFDIIFAGPPYKDRSKNPLRYVETLLEIVGRDHVLKNGGTFIIQHHAKEIFNVPVGWDLFRKERYGDSVLSFFRNAREV